LGQAFDYAQLMEANGLPAPYVAVSTFEESFLCWPKRLPETNGQDSEIIASETSAKTPLSKPIPDAANEEETPSPPSLISQSESSPLDHTSKKPNISNCVMERKLVRTTTFGPHQLVMLLYTGLSMAIEDNTMNPKKKIYQLAKGKTYKFPKALRISEDMEYSWTKLHFTVGRKIETGNHTPSTDNIILARRVKKTHIEQKMEYFIIGTLGYGSTSNVYQAIDLDGTVVAIKVFVNAGNNQGREFSSKEFMERAKTATDNESKAFCLLYPYLKDKVKVVKLYGLPCIVMPFFEPVKKNMRRVRLKEIGEVLNSRFLPNNLQYRADDMRWRHVGVYREGSDIDKQRIVLYDLADLDVLKDGATMVNDHCSALRLRCETEAETEKSPFCAEETF
jgi:Family of unknown function (DUF5898)